MTDNQILDLYHWLVRRQRIVMDTIDTSIALYPEKTNTITIRHLSEALVIYNRRINTAHEKFPWLASYYDNFYNERYF